MNSFFDISVLLDSNTLVYPGDPKVLVEKLEAIKYGDEWNLSAISMSLHAGTHIDIPKHRYDEHNSIDTIPLDRFVFKAQVVDVGDPVSIKEDSIQCFDVTANAILFKTRNSIDRILTQPKHDSSYIYLEEKVAKKCIDLNYKLIGIDYITPEKPDSDSFIIHDTLLQAGLFILESIDLYEVSPGIYHLICFPLKINGAEASPVRAVLLQYR